MRIAPALGRVFGRTPARICRHDQLEASRIGNLAARARQPHVSFLQRCTQTIEYRRGYFTGFVKKEHTIVSQAHRTGAGMTGTATKKCSPSYRGMRSDERGTLDDLTWGSG